MKITTLKEVSMGHTCLEITPLIVLRILNLLVIHLIV